MADELTLVSSARININGINEQLMKQNLSVDVASGVMIDTVQAIGTTEEVLVFTEVGDEGMFWIANMDTTNYVEWGPESGGAMVIVGKLPARTTGEEPFWAGPVRLKVGTVIRAKANTAACNVRFILLSN